jgi:hypothetical protein
MAPLSLVAPAALAAPLSPLGYTVLGLINCVALNTTATNAIGPASN